MNVAASIAPAVTRPVPDQSIFRVDARDRILVRAGTTIGITDFADDVEIDVPDMVPGTDYAVTLSDGRMVAQAAPYGVPEGAIGGFHFAPGGNATARTGGDDTPAINPFSCWDAGFRPACPDPRGMALVSLPDGARFWVDIYKLGVDHIVDGTSRCDVEIADGASLPARPDGKGKVKRLDYATAVSIYAHHGKGLLTYDEFRAAAFGVTEKSAAPRDPKKTGLDAERTSRFGLMQATGNLWDWGTDGDPDEPRPSLFGGSWINGADAGSRYANLGYWPGDSDGDISARGRSGHMNPA